ncbi:AraC family transcriptional regulator [Marinomonas sp. 15G1-11]|uniref:AraC family transcriptional regulator n=1 Tax=Marinomonas phaeophyticola TaxID=3004091 RepID=A0ABT4JTP9_9GAMM|nr:AraC family transcriptional regulator [Marinomonas sp. 15G1-11]MCZ2721776.1 AraC family transcriptional regulator [Marinomonas sp. 15G1-11]
MQLNMQDTYDEYGDVKDTLSEWVQGHKKHVPLLSGLQFSNLHLRTRKDIVFTETATQGLYFSFIGSKAINNVSDIDAVQIHYQSEDVTGQFSMKALEERSLLQVLISTDYLALILGQTEAQVIQHFTSMEQVLSNDNNCIQLPFTQSMADLCKPILKHTGLSISLAGHIYSCIFTLIEQMQMLKHLSECQGCQSKLFKAQNLLEKSNEGIFEPDELALSVGLNIDALSIGFMHLVGESIETYHQRSRIALAAAKLRQDPSSKHTVIKQSGFSEEQFETVFSQHFGVSSNQYRQIH